MSSRRSPAQPAPGSGVVREGSPPVLQPDLLRPYCCRLARVSAASGAAGRCCHPPSAHTHNSSPSSFGLQPLRTNHQSSERRRRGLSEGLLSGWDDCSPQDTAGARPAGFGCRCHRNHLNGPDLLLKHLFCNRHPWL